MGRELFGWAYVQGWGVPVDYVQARYWLEKSAAASDRLGLYNLALMHEGGLGGPHAGVPPLRFHC
jgi:uncharacterized protein